MGQRGEQPGAGYALWSGYCEGCHVTAQWLEGHVGGCGEDTSLPGTTRSVSGRWCQQSGAAPSSSVAVHSLVLILLLGWRPEHLKIIVYLLYICVDLISRRICTDINTNSYYNYRVYKRDRIVIVSRLETCN